MVHRNASPRPPWRSSGWLGRLDAVLEGGRWLRRRAGASVVTAVAITTTLLLILLQPGGSPPDPGPRADGDVASGRSTSSAGVGRSSESEPTQPPEALEWDLTTETNGAEGAGPPPPASTAPLSAALVPFRPSGAAPADGSVTASGSGGESAAQAWPVPDSPTTAVPTEPAPSPETGADSTVDPPSPPTDPSPSDEPTTSSPPPATEPPVSDSDCLLGVQLGGLLATCVDLF